MENLTIKTLRTVDVESEFTLSTCFTINQYTHYKLIDKNTSLAVTFYPSSKESILSLELFPSIRLENLRYVQYVVKPENYLEITEEEFNKHLNEAKKFILSL
jgi:hypothetical protein